MILTTRIYTALFGTLTGSDSFGNRYYRRASKNAGRHGERRWVLFKGSVEASKVTAEWHGWLHHTLKEPPSAEAPRQSWQKPHLPNLTGTMEAYLPTGSLLSEGRHQPTVAEYEAWRP